MKKILFIVCFLSTICGFAQLPFGHEQAIHKDTNIISAWATHCTLQRGYQNIANVSLGYTTVGDESTPIGKALDNGVVSLGDGGIAILTFNKPIKNGTGYDFAVFENGFNYGIDTLFFLELAFVEVSSDGSHFFRFAASSLTDTAIQIFNGQGINPKGLNNLAGKYIAPYGTPFDLDELKDSVGLDVNHITHVKVIDVVGSLDNSYCRRDAAGRKINDPWPTPFISSGFDLSGIGIIHEQLQIGLNNISIKNNDIELFPNPATNNDELTILNSSDEKIMQLEVYNISGRKVWMQPFTLQKLTLSLLPFNKGIYFIRCVGNQTSFTQKLVIE